ncbi:sugar phosphate nucleotidyltransferase [Halalkaliarchaeum sp. AArc-GB]|uniref:sugar phosphate nucleotidyltransferase n=1 Tax=Halalkaliarchaeum sp. AArc-GB TaxID=3074078 RepID=UPI0028557E2A|nr:sugar phosphate nucleotidyltransferase [Halalkaliarchaeum sp. AArc-GB]MDR5672472.1 sugar phosphate nucleotidyltransferase [Halalkaliarchaeum sp. AArc-GB]
MIRQAVVPAAGDGTRLRPLTRERPKGLLAVDGTPILTRCFDQLLAAGITEVVVVVGYRASDIVAEYGDTYRELDLQYVHQRDRLGLGDAVSLSEPFVDGEFLLVNGDNVFDPAFDFGDLLDRHAESDAAVTALAERLSPEDATETGVFEPAGAFDDGAVRVEGVVEKPDEPPSTLASAGCYVLPAEIFSALSLLRPSDRGEYELSDAVDVLCAAGARVEAVELAELGGWRQNVNRPADLDRATERVRDR